MKKLFIFFLSFFFIFASSASATIYKWTDEKGVMNFSDDLSKVPPDYRNKVEEVNIPKMRPSISSQVPSGKTALGAQLGEPAAQVPPIAQALIREGDFAIELAEVLKVGQAQSEAEAEDILASAGITPKNGWIADYPVTPDVIGELQNAITEAVGSGKLTMKKDEAMKVFQDLAAQQSLPIRRADIESEDAGVEPPQNYPEYYEPPVINNYYYDEGPPIVTYYPPPSDYYYMYSWVSYPFWYARFWFPGFFVLRDFHRVIVVHGHRTFCSNHFWDPRMRRFGTIDPARRYMGNVTANISSTRGFTSPIASNGASSILRRSFEHMSPNRPTGAISANRGDSGLPNFMGGVRGVRPPTGNRPPSTGYSPNRGVPLGRPVYSSSFSYRRSFSHSEKGVGRSFSTPSRGGNSGLHSSGFGSSGFSGRGGRGRL